MSLSKKLISFVATGCILFSIVSRLQAQESSKQKWMTFHNHTDVVQNYQYTVPTSNGSIENFQKEDIDYINLGIGFRMINENNRFQEFSLVQLRFSKDDDILNEEFEDGQFVEPTIGDFTKEVNLRLRWEYGMFLSLNNTEKIKPSISVGIDPVWNYYSNTPKTSAGFPFKVHQLGFDLRIIPATAFQLTSRMQLQLAFPVGLLANRWNFSRLGAPILSNDERRQNTYESEFGFNDVQIRVGLGVAL